MRSTIENFDVLFSLGRWDPRSLVARQAMASRGNGWRALRDFVVEVRESADPPSDPGERFRYIGLENVESFTGDLVGQTYKHGGEVKSRSKRFKPNDVLYGRLRPALAKAFWCAPDTEGGYCSGEFIVLRPVSEECYGRVIRELLASPQVADQMSLRVVGAALPRVSPSDLLGLPIPDISHERFRAVNMRLLEGDHERRELKKRLSNQPSTFQSLVWDQPECQGAKRSRKRS